jgi:hypothetical protein
MKPNITHKKCKAAFGGGKSHVAFARASVVLESRERLTFRLYIIHGVGFFDHVDTVGRQRRTDEQLGRAHVGQYP